MPSARRPPLVHPSRQDLQLVDVLHALADPTRLTIVQTLWGDAERACGTFPVTVAASTLTHHFRVLREAGVIRQREEGNRRWTTLRQADLEARFPGLVTTVLQASEHSSSPATTRADTAGAASGDLEGHHRARRKTRGGQPPVDAVDDARQPRRAPVAVQPAHDPTLLRRVGDVVHGTDSGTGRTCEQRG